MEPGRGVRVAEAFEEIERWMKTAEGNDSRPRDEG